VRDPGGTSLGGFNHVQSQDDGEAKGPSHGLCPFFLADEGLPIDRPIFPHFARRDFLELLIDVQQASN
jgi:hypothetical protein